MIATHCDRYVSRTKINEKQKKKKKKTTVKVFSSDIFVGVTYLFKESLYIFLEIFASGIAGRNFNLLADVLGVLKATVEQQRFLLKEILL